MFSDIIVLFIAAVFAALFIIALSFLAALQLSRYLSRGLNYIGRRPLGRQCLRLLLTMLRHVSRPVWSPLSRVHRNGLAQQSVVYREHCYPRQICDEYSLRSVAHLKLDCNDIVIASQMRSGTTWLQQVVIELLAEHSAQGVSSRKPLATMSPFLESFYGVPFNNAPRVGGQRISKTHLLAERLPLSTSARYIYIHREPLDNFRSFCHFINTQSGPFCPDINTLMSFYLSEQMYFGAWATHLYSWWRFAQQNTSVLLLSYEALRNDTQASIALIAQHLSVPLSQEKLLPVQQHSSLHYMAARQDLFAMAAPNLFSVQGDHFPSARQAINLNRELEEQVATRSYSQLSQHGLTRFNGQLKNICQANHISETGIRLPAKQGHNIASLAS